MKRMIRSASEVGTYDSLLEVGQAIVNAWNAALQKADYDEEDIHILNYNEFKQFKKILERELDSRHIDLSFKKVKIPMEGQGFQIEGMTVGGNSGGIADQLMRGVTKKAWEPLSKQYAKEYLEDPGDVDIYTEDKYGCCVPTTQEKALQLVGLGDETQFSGHGSQQYIDDTKVTVYEDYFGNLKVARRTVRWD